MTDAQPRHRFYCPVEFRPGEPIELSERVSEQIRRVLRLRNGDQLVLFDGKGSEAVAQITQSGRKSVLVEPADEPVRATTIGPPEVHLGVALLKSDRFDQVVQKATELGVATISPIECDRCVVSLTVDRARSRRERWQKIAIEALEQCGRSDYVEVHDTQRFEDAIMEMTGERKLLAWEREGATSLIECLPRRPKSVSILIGPEGGFTDREIEQADEAGFETVSLGPTVLRSETAAIAAVAITRAVQSAVAEAGCNDEPGC